MFFVRNVSGNLFKVVLSQWACFEYSILPNRRVYTFISGQVCLLGSIKVKRQTWPEINVYTRLFGSIEYAGSVNRIKKEALFTETFIYINTTSVESINCKIILSNKRDFKHLIQLEFIHKYVQCTYSYVQLFEFLKLEKCSCLLMMC